MTKHLTLTLLIRIDTEAAENLLDAYSTPAAKVSTCVYLDVYVELLFNTYVIRHQHNFQS